MQYFTTITVLALSASSVLSVGRNPVAIEQNACKVAYATQLNAIRDAYRDRHAQVEAFNKGLDGRPCMTSCRLIYGNRNRSIKELDDIYTPNGVQCFQHPLFSRFCEKGRCMLPPQFRDDKV